MTAVPTTFGRLDKNTSRVTIPAPVGAKRVRLTISGTWAEHGGDPTPALIELRRLGGPPVRRDLSPEERSRRLADGRSTHWSDYEAELPEGTVGLEVSVKRPAEGMALVVRLTEAPAVD
jgi:hypothetical protein